MSKKIQFTVEIPEHADVHIETKVVMMPKPACCAEIDLDSMTDEDIDDICDAHYDTGDCPLSPNCPFGGECLHESADG